MVLDAAGRGVPVEQDRARVDGEALLREVEHLERIEDQDGLMRFDERIHRYTWEAAGNPFLTGTLERAARAAITRAEELSRL